MQRKNFVISTLLALSFSVNIFAAGGSWGDAANIPVQEFKQAVPTELPKPQTQVKVATVPQAEQKVLAVSKPNVKEATPLSLENKATLPAENKVAAASTPDSNSMQMLQDEVGQINQNNILYQQTANSRMEEMANRIELLQNQVKQLDQVLLLLNQQIIKLTKSNQTLIAAEHKPHPNIITLGWVQAGYESLGTLGFSMLTGVVVLVLIFLGWLLWPKRSKKANRSDSLDSEEDDTQDEYDYMGSRESTPAKLNLARAYIAMEDYAAAKKVISDVISQGNDQQRKEAEDLNREIPQAGL